MAKPFAEMHTNNYDVSKLKKTQPKIVCSNRVPSPGGICRQTALKGSEKKGTLKKRTHKLTPNTLTHIRAPPAYGYLICDGRFFGR